jgi:Ulp1 family protease
MGTVLSTYGNIDSFHRYFQKQWADAKPSMLIPRLINNDTEAAHWIVWHVDYQNKKVWEYSSMDTLKESVRAPQRCLEYIIDVFGGTLDVERVQTPQQTNSYDCGAFVCWVIKTLSENGSLPSIGPTFDEINRIRTVAGAKVIPELGQKKKRKRDEKAEEKNRKKEE